MKRIAVAVALFAGAMALAGPDTDPWENVTTQKRFTRPTTFQQELGAAFVDAGVVTATTLNVTTETTTTGNFTTVKTTLLDAGSGIVNGNLVIAGTATVATTKTTLLDAGSGIVNGNLVVAGAAVVAVLDAGVGLINGQLQVLGPALVAAGSKVGTVTIATGSSQDAGTGTPSIQWGYSAMAANELAVTFTRAFSANPSCVCSHTQTTNTNACGVKTGTAPSTTAVTFAVASGGTDVIFWQCMGHQ